MRVSKRFRASAAIVALSLPLTLQAGIDEDVVLRLKKTVVNVEKAVSYGLNRESARRSHATGFVVDAERGIIATNRHVAETSPSRVKITFENGESAAARVLHYDIFHDFAFYRVDKSEIGFPLHQAELGDSFRLEEQDEVVMIGNNDVEEYSVKFGRVTNLVLDKGDRHSATFQTSFDRAGGSSGSPVVAEDGKVVGIHFAGSSTTSFEMRIEYVRDALEQLRASGQVRRGDVGVQLGLMRLSDARKHFRLPPEVGDAISVLRPDIKRLIFVDRIAPGSAAEGRLRPGDLVVAVDGRNVGDDLYLFDKIVDGKVGDDVLLTVYRNGTKLVRRLPVPDAEKTKVRRFALFAGGVLHDLNPDVRFRYNIRGDGIYLSQAHRGTPLAELGRSSESSPSSRAVVIEEINGVPTPDLDAFIRAARTLESDDAINMIVRDMRSSRAISTIEWITIDLKYDPLQVFEFEPRTLEWVEVQYAR